MRFEVGQQLVESFIVDEGLVKQFADFSGDRNPIHLDSAVAREYGYPRSVAHGAILVAAISRMIGMKLPGPGGVWLRQVVEWKAPVFIGDKIELKLTVTTFSAATGVMELNFIAMNQKDDIIMEGSGFVKAAERIGKMASSVQEAARVVLVTGGGRGIGTSIVRRLAANDWITAINYLKNASGASNLAAEIRSFGGQAREFQGDVSDPDAVQRMVEKGIEIFGRIDAVVHCATPPIARYDLKDLTYMEMEPYLKTYIGGALALMAATVPGMRQRQFGRFVFLGTSALFGIPPIGWAAYVSAKSALAGLVCCAASELGPMGITVNMVSPGLTITDLTADISLRAKEVEAHRSPLRRLATPEDTANTVAFLLSEAAGYINGVNLPLTGGPI